jgi:hypothetical protein
METNIVIHSIGDRIPTGTFTEIDSVFEKVINLVWEDKVISVGTPELRPGPYNIIVEGIKPEEIKKCEVRSAKCERGEDSKNSDLLYLEEKSEAFSPRFSREGLGVSYEDMKIGILLHRETDSRIGILLYPEVSYDSSLDVMLMNTLLLRENIDSLRVYLLTQGNEDSLVFLLDRKREEEEHPEVCGTLQKGTGNREQGTASHTSDFELRTSNFERAYRKKFKELYAQLKDSPCPENVLAFHSYGYGLTPAGDDFIIGYMMGLKILTALGKNELSKQLEFIYSGLLNCSTNRLVNTYVQMAYEGSYSEPWKLFMTTMLNSRMNHPNASFEAILNIGATSGSDTLVGFITALEFEKVV